ncbi:sister chromatid cohesion protein PDS5 homolog C-like isoform X2 [Impatiens glandulifera]|uniref:sister chromatid cohesion protein PDS5 homolog C-like isoform X2 n=1 Tax=Impatiens glandulifera TaxID=253017 RepID=UPI001FB12448|nr:sister chromatid cohesion protein PDS5 homolog C-like isoform X2 [Impatiens glandulifera]
MASSGVLLEMQLVDAGKKLLSTPISVDELHKMLDHAETVLIKVEQSPPTSIIEAINPAIEALTKEELLNHPDTDIKVLVASCLSEIIRITAPEAPFDDEKTKVIFQLIVSCFEDLSDCTSHSYSRRARVLETLYKVRFCVVMLDLEMESLITEMFVHFLKAIRDYHPDDTFYSMVQVMTLLLEESESIPLVMLSPMLETLRNDNQDVLPAARRMSKSVFENCAAKLKPFLLEAAEFNTLSLNEYNDVVANICGVTCANNNDGPVSKELPANDKNMAPAESTQALKEIVDHEIEGGSTGPIKSNVAVEDCTEVPSEARETSKKLWDYQSIGQGMDAMEENNGESGDVDCTEDDQHSDRLADSNEAKSSDLGKTNGKKIKLKSGKTDGNKSKKLEGDQNAGQSVGMNEVSEGPSGNLDSSMVLKSKIVLKLVNMQKDNASGSSNMSEDDQHADEPKDITEASKPESGESNRGKVAIELKSQSTAQRSSNKPEGTNGATNAEICDLKSIGVAKEKKKSKKGAKRSRKRKSTGSSAIDEGTANDSDVRPKRQQKKKVFFGEVIESDSTVLNGNTEISVDASKNRTEGINDISTESNRNTKLFVDVSNNIDEGTRNDSLSRPKRQLKKKVFFGDVSKEDMSPSLLSSKKRSAKVEKQTVTNAMDENGNKHLPMKRKGGRKPDQLEDSSDEDTIKTSSENDKEKQEVPSELLKLHDNEDHIVETSKRKRTSGKGKEVIQSPNISLILLDDENAEEEECVEENPAMKSKANTLRKVKEVVLSQKPSLKLLDHEDRLVKTAKEEVSSSKPSSLNENNLEESPKGTNKKKQSLERVEGAKLRDEDHLEETPKKKSVLRKRKEILASSSRSKGTGNMKVETKKTYKRRKRQGKEKVVESCQDGHNENLVGVRVKIWWPQDAEYYEGVIDSFDSVTKNHTVLYNDGDMETLTLGDEKWEIVKDDDSEEERAVKKKEGAANESLVILSQLIRKKKNSTTSKRKRRNGDNLKALRRRLLCR